MNVDFRDSSRTVSNELAASIYDDALSAYRDPAHPCHVFAGLQGAVSAGQWQLPEPFNGRSANAGLVFVGLNPSYDPNEDVPRIDSPLTEWREFFRSRFDGEPTRWHKLYRRYQRIGEIAGSSAFRLGVDAIALELIRFRSAKGAGCDDQGVIDHELPITAELLTEIAPRVIVANGAGALWGLQLLLPSLTKLVPIGTPILQVERKRFVVETPWGEASVIPNRHLSASFGFGLEMLVPLAAAVAGGLRG